MGISSYLVISAPGQRDAVGRRIAALPGCDVIPAERHDILLLVAEGSEALGDRELRERVEALEGVHAVALTFAEVEAP